MEESLQRQVHQLRLVVSEQQTKLVHQLHWIQEHKLALEEKTRENAALVADKRRLSDQVAKLQTQLREKVDDLAKRLRASEELVVQLRKSYQERGATIAEMQQTIISLEGTIRQIQQQRQQPRNKLSLPRFSRPRLGLSRSASSPEVLKTPGKRRALQKAESLPHSNHDDSVASPLAPLLEITTAPESHSAYLTDEDTSTVSDTSQLSDGATNGSDSTDHSSYASQSSPEATFVVTKEDIGNLRWGEGRKAPEKMTRGSAVVRGNTTYISPAGSRRVYSCALSSGKLQWSSLPDSKYQNFSLAIVENQLVSVGGQTTTGSIISTKSLLSLPLSRRKKHWIETLPPMSVARCNAAAVTSGSLVIVAGGYDKGRELDIVEVLDISTWQWNAVPSLPKCLSNLVGALCGRGSGEPRLYFAGGFEGCASKSVFSCPVSNLVSGDGSHNTHQSPLVITEEEGEEENGSKSTIVWRQMSDLPVASSTIANFGDCLVSVGGIDDTYQPTGSVYHFDEETGLWSELCVVRSKRERCFAVVLAEGKMIVVGGATKSGGKTDGVEIAHIPNLSTLT